MALQSRRWFFDNRVARPRPNEGVVHVNLVGACGTCPIFDAETLKALRRAGSSWGPASPAVKTSVVDDRPLRLRPVLPRCPAPSLGAPEATRPRGGPDQARRWLGPLRSSSRVIEGRAARKPRPRPGNLDHPCPVHRCGRRHR